MIEQTYERVVQERDMLASAIANAAQKAGIYNGEIGLTGPYLLMLADDLAEVILNMESNISDRLLVPLSADGKYVFIDGPGDVELDYNRILEKLPERQKQMIMDSSVIYEEHRPSDIEMLSKEIDRLRTANDRLMNDLATVEFEHDEDMYRALESIIDRSKNGELGTSKVIDMRKIAEKALAKIN